MITYNAFLQFENDPDIEFKIQAESEQAAELEIRNNYPAVETIWLEVV